MEIVDKTWGSELIIINTPKYCGKILTIKRGHIGSKHYHKKKDETFYVLKGEIKLETWEPNGSMGAFYLCEGETFRILPRTIHRFTGLKQASIVEFSTHHDDNDTYRVKP